MEFKGNINSYFGKKVKWNRRVSIAGELSVSTLLKLDLNNINSLVKLSKYVYEPLVSQYAIAGLVWSLFKSYESKEFQKYLSIVLTVAKNEKLANYILSCIDYFFTDWEKHVDSNIELHKDFKISKWNSFEPLIYDQVFYQFNELPFKSIKERNQFFQLLNGSISISFKEKIRVFQSSNRLKYSQFNDLIKIFTEENERFSELSLEVAGKVNELEFKNGIESFMIHLKIKRKRELTKLKRLLNQIDKSKFALDLYKDFKEEPLLKHIKSSGLKKLISKREVDLVKIGDYFFKEKKFSEAIFIYEKVDIVERNNKILFCLAFAHDKLKNNYKAINYYSEAIKQNPDDILSMYNKSLILAKLKDYEGAINLLKKAVKIKPDYDKGFKLLGDFYRSNKEFNKAILAYNKGIKLNPDKKEYYQSVAYVQRFLKKHNPALKNFKKYASLSKNDVEAICEIASTYNEMGKKEQAIKTFQKALKMNQDYHRALRGIGWVHFTLGEFEKAREVFIQVLEKSLDKLAYMNLGHCELVLYSKKRAIEYYKKSLDLWNCSKDFFTGFDDDYQYLEGVTKKEYNEIKKSLRSYCNRRKPRVKR